MQKISPLVNYLTDLAIISYRITVLNIFCREEDEMLDILDSYLSDTTTPELKEAVRQSHVLFDQFGLDTYERDFEEILATGDEADSHAVVDEVVQLTRSIQFKILNEHGVVISEDAAISRLNVYLEVLKRIPDYDNPGALFSLLSVQNQPEELAAEIFALVSGKAPEDLITDIMVIDPQLFQKIAEELDNKHVAEDDETTVLKRSRIAAYKQYVEATGLKELKLAHLLASGMDVGHPVLVYLNLLGRDFDEMDAEAIAKELVGMCLISSDANENPRDAIKKHLENFVSDMDKLTKVYILVGSILLTLSHFNHHG